MPLYEYECRDCAESFEVLQSISDPYPSCPKCCSDNVKRLISRTSGQVDLGAKELYHQKILPEAKEIARRIRDGDENAAADVLGEGKMFEKGG